MESPHNDQEEDNRRNKNHSEANVVVAADEKFVVAGE